MPVHGRPRAHATASGGRTRWTFRFSIGIPICPIRWARTSTTPRSSRPSTSNAVIKDLTALMTDSQDWWPADFGHYGGLMIRMAWHSAGTYRITDGRGGAGAGQQRFAPLNSWPDNANLDKARRLLWPIKQKYGRKTLLGRPDGSSPATSRWIRWASRRSASPAAARTSGSPKSSTGVPRARGSATNATAASASSRSRSAPCRWASSTSIRKDRTAIRTRSRPAKDIRETFFRMAMNDEETVALIAGGHTFGKTHGAGDPSLIGPDPESGAIEDQGLGWKSKFNTGIGATPSRAVRKSPGRRRRRSGATTSSGTCSATNGN